MIIDELRVIQDRLGHLPADELRGLSERLRVPLYRLHELASFFPHFRLRPAPRVRVHVCHDLACHLRGASALSTQAEQLASEIAPSEIEVSGASCLGQCDRAPAVAINDHVLAAVGERALAEQIRAAAAGHPVLAAPTDTSPVSWQIDPYGGRPTYAALRRLVESGAAEHVLAELKTADLRGMGGAGFRTHVKWASVRAAAGSDKYVICNADESEPGTFKDRELLRRAPHLVIEGMVIAGLVTGATAGIIYIRHEYKAEIAAVEAAVRQASELGVCGERVLGSGRAFCIRVFVSPGGYICGEETALLEVLEDRRAEPRNKPPYPVEAGLHGRPTVINNVETLAWVPAILSRGGAWYRDAGVRGATGLRLVSVSGDVVRPGAYEVPFGFTVRELVQGPAGGVRDGQQLKAIAPSGPSSGFLPARIRAADLPRKFRDSRLPADADWFDAVDLPLDFTSVAELGSMLGGAFFVVGDRACMVDLALNATAFFRNESCGKCVPCRLGSQKLAEILGDVARGACTRDRLAIVDELAQAMSLTSICGLGMVAANPVSSVVRYFREELAEHVEHRRCPAGVCRFA